MKAVSGSSEFHEWSRLALSLLEQQTSPDEILWADESPQPLLPGLAEAITEFRPSKVQAAILPRAFATAARQVLAHRDSAKWPLLYRVFWRLHHETADLLHIASDEEICQLRRFEQQVRHDTYRMTQFVRFRRVQGLEEERFIAWHRPDHNVLRMAAPFFVKRFARMRWSIITPLSSAHWDRETLTFSAGLPREKSPTSDELEELWRIYYAAICNPARINPKAMSAQMPGRFWTALPEAAEIGPLLTQARGRVSTMIQDQRNQSSAALFVPPEGDLSLLKSASRSCQGCDLHVAATQTVFGQGPPQARVMMVGEQPGDEEDRRGVPFVGPAGTLLDQALNEAGLDRQALYVTNAVKHFRFTPVGRTRRHQTPRPSHITACRPWLEAELRLVQPDLIVCLGATAARALLGFAVSVMEQRGKLLSTEWSRGLLITIHPAAILRGTDAAHRERLYRILVADLMLIAHALRTR